MSRVCVFVTVVLALSACVFAETVSFTLLTHGDNVGRLAHPTDDSGDHLIQTTDDITGLTYNPDGCFSFNFMNRFGASEPPGYAVSAHCMTTGSLVLDMDLAAGGAVGIDELAFNGFISDTNPIAHQWLVRPGDAAADGNHGPVDGEPNSGSYQASVAQNWAFEASFDWYYDTPYHGPGTIDMTFNDFPWEGFIIPVSELTDAGMAATTLDDPLGYFDGDFESWLLAEVAQRLPEDAVYLLFAQGEAHPAWTESEMGMSTSGIIGETIIAYAVPEPVTVALFAAGLCPLVLRRRGKKPR